MRFSQTAQALWVQFQRSPRFRSAEGAGGAKASDFWNAQALKAASESNRYKYDGNGVFTPGILQPSFTANNSVIPGGIHAFPNQTTGGNGSITGQEVAFNVNFNMPFNLPADHYFFVPQVQLANGDFFWLSAPKPIATPGTPFPPGFTDLQG